MPPPLQILLPNSPTTTENLAARSTAVLPIRELLGGHDFLLHPTTTENLAASTTAVLLIRETLGGHDSLLHVTEQGNVRVQEEQGNHGTNKVHKQDNTEDSFNTEPDGGNHHKCPFELQCSVQAQSVANDSNHKGRNHQSKSLESGSVHLRGKADKAKSCESKSDTVHSDTGGSGVTAKATVENEM